MGTKHLSENKALVMQANSVIKLTYVNKFVYE